MLTYLIRETCDKCGYTYDRYQASLEATNFVCGKCDGDTTAIVTREYITPPERKQP